MAVCVPPDAPPMVLARRSSRNLREAAAQLSGDCLELRQRLNIESTWTREGYLYHGINPTRSRRQQDDAISKKHGFGDRVCHQYDRLASFGPDTLQFEVHCVAR